MEAVLEDYRSAPIPDREKALFGFIEKITRQSNATRQEDIDALKEAGWSEEAIYDAIMVCALFQYYNTWIDATGVHDMPAAAYDASGVRLAQAGYVAADRVPADADVADQAAD